MKYVILTMEWCASRHLIIPSTVRKSIDGTKIIRHYEDIVSILTETDVIDIFDSDSEEFKIIINSSDWTEKNK